MFKEDPHELKLFQEYSREACKLECLVNKILKVCQCLPWDFIRPDGLDVGIPCYGKQLLCPKSVIAENSNVGCGCPLDCNIIKYTYSVESKPWNVDDYCYIKEKDPESLINVHAKWRSWMKELDYPMSYTTQTVEWETTTLCDEIMKQGVKLTTSYQDATATRMTKAQRVSMADLLASLGE